MKIYIGHSNELNFEKELYQPVRNSNLNRDHEIILPHEIYDNAVDFVTRDIIKKSDLMIAEVSYPSTELGIEIGWADTSKCPIICIYKKNHKISESLKVVTNHFVEYVDVRDLIDKISTIISTR